MSAWWDGFSWGMMWAFLMVAVFLLYIEWHLAKEKNK